MTIDILSHAVELFSERNGYRPAGLRAALIDMDGTLYDSMRWHARAWARMVADLGIDFEEDEFYAYEGMTGKATINLILSKVGRSKVSDTEAARLYSIKANYFAADNKTEIMPGAQEMVRTLCDFGIKPVLVTGSAQSLLLERLDADFSGAFDPVKRVTATNVTHGKPAPEPYLKGLEIAEVKPREAIVIENAPLGVESGHRAGIFTIGVNTGPLSIELLRNAGADLVFNSMQEFADFLPELLLFLKTFPIDR